MRYKGIAGEIVKYGSTCPYRKSNPGLLMVQTPEMWAKRSMLLKAIRFGALRRSTLSWCRRTRISASNRALNRNSLVNVVSRPGPFAARARAYPALRHLKNGAKRPKVRIPPVTHKPSPPRTLACRPEPMSRVSNHAKMEMNQPNAVLGAAKRSMCCIMAAALQNRTVFRV